MSVADSVTLDWTNNAYDGDELLEIFRRLTTGPGAWAKVKTVLHNNSAAQEAVVTDLNPLTEYDFAVRSQRGGLYRAGWESANPSLWDDAGLETGAMVAAVATSAFAPYINVTEWSRTSGTEHIISIGFPGSMPAGGPAPEGCTVEIERGTNGVDFTPLDETAADATDYQDIMANGAAGVRYYYRLRYKRGALVGAWSDVVSCYAGPLAPELLSVYYANRNATDDGVVFYDEWGFVIAWPAGSYQGVQEAEAEVDIGSGFASVTPLYIGGVTDTPDRPGDVNFFYRTDPFEYCGLGPLDARVRAKQTAFAHVDYSEYSTMLNSIECDAP